MSVMGVYYYEFLCRQTYPYFFPSHGTIWANLWVPNIKLTARQGQKYKSWANAFAVFNWIPAPHSIHDDWQDTISAQHIPVQYLLPSFKDWATLQERMVALTLRMLSRNIPYVKPLSLKYVEQHVEHEYSQESKMISEIASINLTIN